MKHKRTRRGDIPLFFRYTDPVTGLPRSKTVYGKTEEEAAEKKAAFLDMVGKGISLSNDTLQQWSVRWLSLYKSGVAPSTLKGYQYHINTINAVAGGIPLRSITPATIMSVYSSIQGKSASKIHHVKTILNAMLDAAVDNKLIPSNPAIKAKPPKGEKGTHRALTLDEIRAIITVARYHRYAAPIMLMLFCGLRRGEACAITDEDILSNSSVCVSKSVRWADNKPTIVSPKTRAGIRVVSIPLFIRDYMRFKGYSTGGDQPPTLMAFKRGFGSYMTAVGVLLNGCTRRWTRGKKWVDPNIKPHDLRHTYATLLHDAGVDIKTAQRWLGHSSPSLTLGIYTHLTEARLAQSSTALSSYLVQSLVQSKTDQNGSKQHKPSPQAKKKTRQIPYRISGFTGDPSATRTRDTLIKSQVLCRLS